MEGVTRARNLAPLITTLAFSLVLTLVGYRLFVDATAAVLYNADERTPEATEWAWIYAAIWGFGNGALALYAYRAGLLRPENGLVKILAAGLLVLDLSLLVLLGIRGRDFVFTTVFALVVAALVLLAWRRPGLGGSLLMAAGALLTFGSLFGSASYEGEAAGLLYDEDTFAILSIGLVPFVCGFLFILSRLLSRWTRYA